MPSDAKKREQQRKKDAAKARQGGKKTNQNSKPETDEQVNGTKANGDSTQNGCVELTAEGMLRFIL